MLAELLHKVAEFDLEESYPYSPRPSLAGPERCIRQLDYYARGYERKPFPGRFITVLDDSSWHEQLILDWIRKSAFEIHSEQMEIKVDYLTGHIDGIITDILGNDRLLEIKAISHFGFQDIWNGHLPLDYITQTALYLRGLSDINPDICEGLLFIKNKNQSQYLEISMQYNYTTDEIILNEMILSTGEKKAINQSITQITNSPLAKFAEIDSYKQDKKFHDRQYERDSWRCQYCPYGEICWEGWEKEIEAMVEGEASEEFETMCRYYKESAAHASEMDKEQEDLKKKIKVYMKEHGWNKIRAGEYTAILGVQSKTGIDQSKIPPAILEQAKQKNSFEVLRVNRKKGERT